MANRFAAVSVAILTLGTATYAFATEPREAQSSFITSVAQAGQLEVDAAWRAVTNARSAAVKEFAYRIIYDYERINSELATIAVKKAVPIPLTLDQEHALKLQALRDSSSQGFDSAYLTTMIGERNILVDLLQSNLLNPDSDLAAFASYNLPRIREHKRLAAELKAELDKNTEAQKT